MCMGRPNLLGVVFPLDVQACSPSTFVDWRRVSVSVCLKSSSYIWRAQCTESENISRNNPSGLLADIMIKYLTRSHCEINEIIKNVTQNLLMNFETTEELEIRIFLLNQRHLLISTHCLNFEGYAVPALLFEHIQRIMWTLPLYTSVVFLLKSTVTDFHPA